MLNGFFLRGYWGWSARYAGCWCLLGQIDGPIDVGHLDQGHLDVEPFVARHTVVDIAVVAEVEGREEKGSGSQLSLFLIAQAQPFADFEQL